MDKLRRLKNNGTDPELAVEKLKKQIPTCNILGVNVAATNLKEAVEFVCSNIKKLSGHYICISNVHTTVMSHDNEAYCRIQNGSILSLPDGKPLSVICKKRGYDKSDRVTGPDLMGELFKLSEKNGFRHYFYGSKEATLDALKIQLIENYPNMYIAGMYSPPFRPLSEEENISIEEMINAAEPDIVWVGLGAPKQEIWMSNNKGKVKGLMVGVGAGFDYYAGNIKRAPRWMQLMCMEWFYRLLQDPKRLWKRYMKTNWKFLWLIFKKKRKLLLEVIMSNLSYRIRHSYPMRVMIWPYLNISRYLRKKTFKYTKHGKFIATLKNSHLGERCFIIGNGPSLTIEDLAKLKGSSPLE